MPKDIAGEIEQAAEGMSESSPLMYHGSGAFGNQGQVIMMSGGQERPAPRQYPLELLQYMGGMSGRSGGSQSGAGSPRRDTKPGRKSDNTAFGYESDDSSLSSNASGSNKSSEKGDNTSRTSETSSSSGTTGDHQTNNYHNYNNYNNNYYYNNNYREWRGRNRRDPRPRRIAPERYLNASYPFQVKFTPDDLLNGSKWDTLSQEIWDKFVKSQQTEETFRNKMNLWRYLYVTIKTIFPRYGLYVVGSTMSGFGLSASDLDLCLYVRAEPSADPRAHALTHLTLVHHYIRTIDPGAELIQAKVPILKFNDLRHGLQVDLNCNNVVGIRNTNLLYCYSRLDWRVRPLVVAVKLWASAHDINDARRRTLSSYSLTLMCIHFLQCGVTPAVLPVVSVRSLWEWSPPRAANKLSLAELFLRFLHYYAHFPYDKMAVSVRLGRAVPVADCRVARSHKNDPHQWKLLCVEEPFDLTNTARSVYDPETFEKIVETFRDSYQRLSNGLRLQEAWPTTAAAR